MEKKNSGNGNFIGFILKNIGLAILIFVGLVWATLFLIDFYTHHGQTEKVPDLKGLTIEQVEVALATKGLKVQIIDSVYIKDKVLGTVIEQNPSPNTIVKPGRSIYLIINSKAIRQIVIPDITDVSVRQAEAMLKSIGINVGTIEYAPSDYKDLVIDIKYQGQSVAPGSHLPDGSTVVLVAGSGYGTGAAVAVPNIVGMNLVSASGLMSSASLILGGIIYDVEPMGDEDSYIIYDQRPFAGDSVASGTRIDVWLSKDHAKKPAPKKAKVEPEKTEDIENFF